MATCFKFDPMMWLSASGKAQLLTHEEKGIFVDIFSLALCGVPLDESLYLRLKIDKAKLSKVKQKFILLGVCLLSGDNDELLSVKFADEELDRARELSIVRSKTGRKGGKVSKRKQVLNKRKSLTNRNLQCEKKGLNEINLSKAKQVLTNFLSVKEDGDNQEAKEPSKEKEKETKKEREKERTKEREKEINKEREKEIKDICRQLKVPTLIFNRDAGKIEGIQENDIERWSKAYPTLDVNSEILKAELWLIANPSRLKKNYRRYLTNWLSRHQTAFPQRLNNLKPANSPASQYKTAKHQKGV